MLCVVSTTSEVGLEESVFWAVIQTVLQILQVTEKMDRLEAPDANHCYFLHLLP